MAKKSNKCVRNFEHIWIKVSKWSTKTHNVYFCPLCKGKRWVGTL